MPVFPVLLKIIDDKDISVSIVTDYREVAAQNTLNGCFILSEFVFQRNMSSTLSSGFVHKQGS